MEKEFKIELTDKDKANKTLETEKEIVNSAKSPESTIAKDIRK